MATYDLNQAQLNQYLGGAVPTYVKTRIENALKAAGTYPSGSKPTVRVDELNTKGDTLTSVHEDKSVDLVVDAGGGVLNIRADDHIVIATGKQDVTVNVTGGPGATVIAGSGNDRITVNEGNNVLFAGGGLDTLRGGSGHDTLYGAGKTNMFAGSGGSTLIGGRTVGAHDTLHGGAGNDLLKVTQGDNKLYASGGVDTLQGGSGHDTLYGSGHSVLYAGSGGSTLLGGNVAFAHDTLYGGSGSDYLRVTRGADTLVGGSGGNDTLIGGQGADKLYISKVAGATDKVDGGAGNDTLSLSDRNFADATISTNKAGVTTIHFADNQTIKATNVETIKFGDQTVHLTGGPKA